MLTMKVTADLRSIKAMVSGFDSRQAPFAVAKALTKTAQDVQAAVRGEMPKRFTLRRQWIVQGIRIIPAKKADLTATVYSRDSAFMGRQEYGGTKTPMVDGMLAIPLSAVRRTKSNMIQSRDLPKNLKNTLYPKGGHKGGPLTAKITTADGKQYLARVKRGYKGRKDRLEFLYALRPRASVKARLGLHDIGTKTAQQLFDRNLKDAAYYAMLSAR